MKLLKYILFTCIGVSALQGCKRVEDPIFETSSAQRMNDAIAKYDEVLQSAPYGWSMDYYYGSLQYPDGGYKMLMKFKDGQVSIASELDVNKVSPGTAKTSSYSFSAENGPILNFNSYNPVLHYFSEATSSNRQGLGGDYEFIMESVTPEKIIMRGKKNGHRIVMRPLTEEKDFAAYINEVTALKTTLSKLMRFELNTNANKAVNIDQNKFYDTDKPDSITYYAVSDKGIDLQNPVVIDGKAYDQFVLDAEEKTFVAKENTQVRLQSVKLAYEDIPGTYKLSYVSNVGSKSEIVKIEPKVAGKTYSLISKTFILPIELQYVDGNLIFAPHALGDLPNGGSGKLWMTIGYDVNFIIASSITYSTDANFIMGGLWLKGSRQKPLLKVLSQYKAKGLFGTFPMKYIGIHQVSGSTKSFYSNAEGVHQIINVQLEKQ